MSFTLHPPSPTHRLIFTLKYNIISKRKINVKTLGKIFASHTTDKKWISLVYETVLEDEKRKVNEYNRE